VAALCRTALEVELVQVPGQEGGQEPDGQQEAPHSYLEVELVQVPGQEGGQEPAGQQEAPWHPGPRVGLGRVGGT
jgi:hypothetical protein